MSSSVCSCSSLNRRNFDRIVSAFEIVSCAHTRAEDVWKSGQLSGAASRLSVRQASTEPGHQLFGSGF